MELRGDGNTAESQVKATHAAQPTSERGRDSAPPAPNRAPLFRGLIQEWIGLDRPLPADALAAVDWRPDSSDAYCFKCGRSVGEGETTPRGCAACRATRPAINQMVRLGSYDGSLARWIRAIKYENWPEMAAELGTHLGRAVRLRLRRTAGTVCVVPMPMPWQRRLFRGIDHAQVIAEGVARVLDVPTRRVLRRGNGSPQVSLALSERRRRAGRGMRLRSSAESVLRPISTVILVDDVSTTGATARAAARLIRRLGRRRIIGAVLAVTDEPGRRRTTIDSKASAVS